MGSAAAPEDCQNSTELVNNHESKSRNKQNNSKMSEPPKKVYSQRNSYLTDLMAVNHLQSMYNIMVATLCLLLLNAFLFYITTPNVFWKDMEIMRWASSDVFYCLNMWIFYNLFAFAMLQGFKLWVDTRNKINSKVADILFFVLYISAIVSLLVVHSWLVVRRSLPPITGLIISLEHVRIFMKIHSFVRESTPRAKQYKPSKDGNQATHLYPSKSHYLYYLFAPVLIYRDTYPRVKDVNWSYVFQSLFKFFACIFIAYCMFMRFIVDIFSHTGLYPINVSEMSQIYAGATFVGAAMMFLIFYCVLHSWLNFFAEMLQFGDREFYQDWWNSTSFSQYYRRWNLVVYDWLYTYIYIDTAKLGFSRSTSMITVFFISALVHEYIIGLALGFFYPVLMVIYSTVGVIVMFITKKRTGEFWNTLMWGMLFAGWGVIVVLYSSEWYARVNCPNMNPLEKGSMKDFFTPRSWSKNCHIFKFQQ